MSLTKTLNISLEFPCFIVIAAPTGVLCTFLDTFLEVPPVLLAWGFRRIFGNTGSWFGLNGPVRSSANQSLPGAGCAWAP